MYEEKRKPIKKIEKEKVKKDTILKVTEDTELLKFLLETLKTQSRNNVKSLLSNEQIIIKDEVVRQFNHKLKAGDEVVINWSKIRDKDQPLGLKIVYEDDYLIGVEKDAGVLSVETEKNTAETAYSALSDYLKKKNPKAMIFIVHRLDRDTSGVMIFAKNQEVQKKLRDSWQESVKERKYVAVVQGTMKEDEGTIISWLKENKAMIVYSSQKEDDGYKAITHYKVIKKNYDYSLVELDLETGRKNQIRVHMMDMGHSVIGDEKYKSTTDPIFRLGLHAKGLKFIHPVTGEEVNLETKIPEAFLELFI